MAGPSVYLEHVYRVCCHSQPWPPCPRKGPEPVPRLPRKDNQRKNHCPLSICVPAPAQSGAPRQRQRMVCRTGVFGPHSRVAPRGRAARPGRGEPHLLRGLIHSPFSGLNRDSILMAGAGAAGDESSQTPQLARGTSAGAPACAAFTAEAPLLPEVLAGGRHVGVLLGAPDLLSAPSTLLPSPSSFVEILRCYWELNERNGSFPHSLLSSKLDVSCFCS